MPVQPLADDLWIADDTIPASQTFVRVPLPAALAAGTTRMTIVRLASGGLLLHSPVRPSAALVDEVAALGKVELIVAPCVMHTTYARPWHERFPDARVWVAPRTAKRAPQLAGFPELDDAKPIAPDELPQVLMAGHTNYETLFFHAKSRTLIVTDLVYNLARRAALLEKLYFRVNGVKNPLGVTGYSRRAVRKPELFRPALERVLEWDFDRVIMSHGDVVSTGGHALFTRAWS